MYLPIHTFSTYHKLDLAYSEDEKGMECYHKDAKAASSVVFYDDKMKVNMCLDFI